MVTAMFNRTYLLILLLTSAVALTGCASTATDYPMADYSPQKAPSSAAVEFNWPQQQSLLWQLGQNLKPQQLTSPALKVMVGPAANLQPWPAAMAGQQRQRQLQQALRQLGFQGQIISRYQPELSADLIRIEAGYGQ